MFYYQNIIILGTSSKIINFLKKNVKYKSLAIVPWRQINLKKKLNAYTDLIIVCGYDYNSYKYEFKKFYNTNVLIPLQFIKKNYCKKTSIIYINTLFLKKRTYSRYYFAKHKLYEELKKNFYNFKSAELPLVVNNKKIDVYGSDFNKYLFKILLYFKLIKSIDYNKVSSNINLLLQKNYRNNAYQAKVKGYFLKIPRTILLDRILRLL
jgi:hypothetical protein